MFEKFYTKEKNIVPDIAELETSHNTLPTGHFIRNKRIVVSGIETYVLEILPETASFIQNKYDRHKNNQFYKIARWRGEEVFFKQITQPNGEKELAILRTLDKIGIPVLFRGVVKIPDGALYMVNTFQDGPAFKSLAAAFQSVDRQYHQFIRQQLESIFYFYNMVCSIRIFNSWFQKTVKFML